MCLIEKRLFGEDEGRLSIRLHIDYSYKQQWHDPHIRILSKWTNCITTEVVSLVYLTHNLLRQ